MEDAAPSSSTDQATIPPTEEGFNVDFEIQMSEDQKQATVVMKSANPLSAEDLVYVFEQWTGEMKKRLGEIDAVPTNPT